jgi:hypothetical protein
MSKYQFKHENWGDDWQDWDEKKFGNEPIDEEQAAEMIAEYEFDQYPCDADRYEFEVEIKSDKGTKKFSVTASYSIDFYGREIE